MGLGADLFAEDEIRQRLSAPLREILSPLRSVDGAESDFDLLPIDQNRDRIPVCDPDDLAFEVAGNAQNGLKNMGWGWFFGFNRFSARSGLANSQP